MNFKKITAVALAAGLCLGSLSGCGSDNSSKTVATLGDQTVSFGFANFMARFQQAESDDYMDQYASYYGLTTIWDQDLSGSGTTMQEQVIDQVMDTIHEYYTCQAQAEDLGITLTDEEETAISDAVAEFIDNEKNQDALEEMGATGDYAEQMLRLATIRQKVYDYVTENADVEVTDEEANMRAYTLVSIPNSSYTDETSGETVEYTDEEKEELLNTAGYIANTAAEGEDLATAAETYGYTASTGTYDADDSTLDSTLKDALDALAEGEVSGVIEGSSAYYIARIDSDTDEEATESNRASLLSEKQSDAYDEQLSAWQEDDGWTVDEDLLAAISFKNTFTQTEESTETTESTESGEVSATVDGTEAQ